MAKQSDYKRPRIIFMCSEETREALAQWAAEEKRSLSNLIERIADDASAAKFEHHQPQINDTLIFVREESKAFTLALLLKSIIDGRRPSDEQIFNAAQSEEIDSRKLLDLCDKLFPEQNAFILGNKE